MKIHIVQKGDSLWKIAKKYGVNFELLKKTNSQLSNPDMLMPGMKIKIPETISSPKKETDTKVNFGVKEAPIQNMTQSKPQPMKQTPVKEMPMPIQKKESVKEMPKVPYVAPKATVKPIMPDIDINNYYMMNMTKMEVPPPMPIYKEKPKKEEPVILKEPIKEKPVVESSPEPMPLPEPKPLPEPMPLPTPLPHYDYCPPAVPYYDPCCYPYMYNPCYLYHMPYIPQPIASPYYQPMIHPQAQAYGMESFHFEQESMDFPMYGHGQMTKGAVPQQMYMQPSPYYMMPQQPVMPSYGYGHYPQPYGMMSHEGMTHGHDSESSSDLHGGTHMPYEGYIPQCGFMPSPQTGGQGAYYQPVTQSAQQYEYPEPMQQPNVQNPYAAQKIPYQEVSGMTGKAESVPFYNPHAAQMIPRINPAAFDRPGADDEESSEQDGQS